MKLASIICLSIVAVVHARSGATPKFTPSGFTGLSLLGGEDVSRSTNPSVHQSIAERSLEDSSSVPFDFSNDDTSGHDFDWRLEASSDFFEITQNSTTDEAMLSFFFVTGTQRPYKRFEFVLLEMDCATTAKNPEALTLAYDNRDPNNLVVSVSVDESLLATSSYFSTDAAEGLINFCIVVNYNYVGFRGTTTTMSFLHTTMAATVDLTADFELTDVRTTVDSEHVTGELDYDFQVFATFCELDPLTVFAQGSVFELCVFAGADANFGVKSIESLILRQKANEGGRLAMLLINEGEPSQFSRYKCSDGQCRVQVLIPVQFHEAIPLTSLELEGSAILELGNGETRHVRGRSLYQDDKTETLPETSTGFRAQVFISSSDDEDSSSAASIFEASLFALLAWSFIGAGFLW